MRGEAVRAGTPIGGVGDATNPVTGTPMTEDGHRWSVQCTNAAGRFFEYGIGIPAGETPVDPVTVRNSAVASLAMPAPAMAANPPLDDPDRFSVVRIPTWFWIADPWEPITSTASDGGITVTVTATPISVTWDPGDGSASVVCDDAGVAWQPGLGDDDTDCSYTYTQSSAGEADDAYRLSATVAWDLTWTINGIDQGRFATYEPTTTVDHRVGEIQSVGSG